MQRKEYGILQSDGNTSWIQKSFLQEVYTDHTIKAIQINNNFSSSDVFMYYCGIENCQPGHRWGPVIKDHFLIHYIFEGKGKFNVNNKTYHLSKYQGFLINPYTPALYEADQENPWKYAWVGFHGLNAKTYLQLAGLTQETPVFTFSRNEKLYECMLEMTNVFEEYKYGAALRLQSLLYRFFSELLENAGRQNEPAHIVNIQEIYVQKTVSYIMENYSKNISVSSIASHLGLDRSYLSTIFKRLLNVSPLMFIIQYRINKACELLTNTSSSISEVAGSVGYDDLVVFRKVFKSLMGVCPREYRKQAAAT